MVAQYRQSDDEPASPHGVRRGADDHEHRYECILHPSLALRIRPTVLKQTFDQLKATPVARSPVIVRSALLPPGPPVFGRRRRENVPLVPLEPVARIAVNGRRFVLREGEWSGWIPVKFEMAVNVKKAKLLGLSVPPSILLRADEVIE